MNIQSAIIHGSIWSMMWAGMILVIFIKWPHFMLHNYPQEIQKVVKLPPIKHKRAGIMFQLLSMTCIILFIFCSGIKTYSSSSVSFFTIWSHIFIVAMSWNIFDLLVIDWLIFCLIQPKLIILPGSEGYKDYKNYNFHFIGFVKGTVISAIGTVVIAVICFGILKYIIW